MGIFQAPEALQMKTMFSMTQLMVIAFSVHIWLFDRIWKCCQSRQPLITTGTMICLTYLLVFTAFFVLPESANEHANIRADSVNVSLQRRGWNVKAHYLKELLTSSILCTQMEENLIPTKCNALAFKIDCFFFNLKTGDLFSYVSEIKLWAQF